MEDWLIIAVGVIARGVGTSLHVKQGVAPHGDFEIDDLGNK